MKNCGGEGTHYRICVSLRRSNESLSVCDRRQSGSSLIFSGLIFIGLTFGQCVYGQGQLKWLHATHNAAI
jgi:hypothetical protein